MHRRLFLQGIAAPLGASLLPAPAIAQAWPSRTIRLLEPNAAGSATDVTLRVLTPAIQANWSQPVIVDNRPGASGNIALEALVASAPDGYTLAHATNNMLTANPHLFSGSRVSPFTDLVLAAPVSNVALVLVVRADSPWRTLGELLDDARRQPGKVSYGTPGLATPMHLVMELVQQHARAGLVHVPYKGGPLIIGDLLSGNVSAGVLAYGPTAGLVQQGKLRVLASAGSARLSMLPDVPAFAETVPEAGFGAWTALVAPKGTPKDICDQLARQVRTVLARPDVVERLRPMGIEPLAGSAETLLAGVRQEHARFGELIRRLDLKV